MLEPTAGKNKGKVLGTLRANPPAFVVADAEAEGARMRIVRLLGESGLQEGDQVLQLEVEEELSFMQ
eukprot:6774397-Heterocapsa_arctica.AAC.1